MNLLIWSVWTKNWCPESWFLLFCAIDQLPKLSTRCSKPQMFQIFVMKSKDFLEKIIDYYNYFTKVCFWTVGWGGKMITWKCHIMTRAQKCFGRLLINRAKTVRCRSFLTVCVVLLIVGTSQLETTYYTLLPLNLSNKSY